MANTLQMVPGKLTPEEAERLAASFRPAWELDDAPFAQGNSLSAADIDALGGGGLNAEVAKAAPTVTVPKRAHVDTAPAEAVIVDVDIESAPAPAPILAKPASQRPQAPRAPAQQVRPRAPVAAADASDEYMPVKKSNTGIFIGVGAVVALLLVGVGVKVMMGGKDDSKPATSIAQPAQTSETTPRIPPPPVMNDTTDTPAATPTAKLNTTPAPTAKVDTTLAPTTPKPPPVVAANPAPTAKITTTAPPATTAKPKTNKGSIVHDNPF